MPTVGIVIQRLHRYLDEIRRLVLVGRVSIKTRPGLPERKRQSEIRIGSRVLEEVCFAPPCSRIGDVIGVLVECPNKIGTGNFSCLKSNDAVSAYIARAIIKHQVVGRHAGDEVFKCDWDWWVNNGVPSEREVTV